MNIATASATTNQLLATSDTIQLLIAGITLLAVLVALFGERLWKHKDRPKIEVYFDDEDPECYHLTNMHIHQNEKIIESIPTYYIRLRVTNSGTNSLENTEVILKRVEPRPGNFMSLNLSWAGYNNAPNDITRTVRIPQGVTRIVDIIEIMEPNQTVSFANKLESNNDSDTERYKAYSKGFRCCSIKPNTLSDIFPAGKHVFYIGVYADNTKPKIIKLSINYDGSWGTEGIKKMRSKHLKVKLL